MSRRSSTPFALFTLFAAAAAIASLMAAPAASGASTVTSLFEGSLSFEAEAGDANQVTVVANPTSVTISDPVETITTSVAGCAGSGTNTVVCAAGAEEFFSLNLALDVFEVDEKADTLTLSGSVRVSANAGGGNDTLTSNGIGRFEAFGNDGNDTVNGGSGDDYLSGGAGTDTLNGNSGLDALEGGEGPGDVVNGNAGSDVFLGTFADGGGDQLSGGGGLDTLLNLAVEPGPAPSFAVDLGAGFSTVSGETDPLSSIEDVVTFQGDDTVTGSGGANRIITALDEEPVLAAVGGIGSEIPVDAGDTVNPKGGPDFVSTGTGNDIVDLVDGSADRLDCGPGTDLVEADQLDELLDCENVDRTTLTSDDDSGPSDPPLPPAPDVAPVCKLQGLAPRYRRKAFLRGVGGSISCNEPVALEVRVTTPARAPRKGRKVRRNKRREQRATASRAGDLVLVETTEPLAFGRSLRLTPTPRLRPFLGPSFRATLQIVARDLAGKATVLQQVIRVLPDRKKGKKKGKRGKRAGKR